jgi:hypothetical protein
MTSPGWYWYCSSISCSRAIVSSSTADMATDFYVHKLLTLYLTNFQSFLTVADFYFHKLFTLLSHKFSLFFFSQRQVSISTNRLHFISQCSLISHSGRFLFSTKSFTLLSHNFHPFSHRSAKSLGLFPLYTAKVWV